MTLILSRPLGCSRPGSSNLGKPLCNLFVSLFFQTKPEFWACLTASFQALTHTASLHMGC